MNQNATAGEQLEIDVFRREMLIDKNALDDALIAQPELYMKIATAHVLAVSRLDEVKEGLKLCEASLSLRIRAEEEGKKSTESAIQARIQVDPARAEAVQRVQEASLLASEWQALKETCMQRSYVLKDLASLFMAGYFASNSVKVPEGVKNAAYEDNRRILAAGRPRMKMGE